MTRVVVGSSPVRSALACYDADADTIYVERVGSYSFYHEFRHALQHRVFLWRYFFNRTK